jgi:hypothetical protein
MLRILSVLTVLATFVVHATAGGVRILDGSESPSYATIQEAVDAAANGSLLLVGEGSYAGFRVDGKGLALVALPGATVLVTSGIEISNVPRSATLVLSGLQIHAAERQHAIHATDCAGTLLVQDCSAEGGLYETTDGLRISSCAWVAVSRSELYGGRDWSLSGAGLDAVDSTFTVHESLLRGGDGLSDGSGPSDGGDGCHAQNSWFFAAGSTFRGGKFDHGCDTSTDDAHGGAGLWLDSPAATIDCTFVGGRGAGICPGIPGQPIEGCCLDQRPYSARSVATVRATADGRAMQVIAEGEPYDSVYLFVQGAHTADLVDSTTGVPWVDPPRLLGSTPPLGVIPPSGAPLDVEYRAPSLPNPTVARAIFMQGFVRPYVGPPVLAEPSYAIVLNAQALPDCDGDGVQDYVAILDGVVPDANHNLVPDACEP